MLVAGPMTLGPAVKSSVGMLVGVPEGDSVEGSRLGEEVGSSGHGPQKPVTV